MAKDRRVALFGRIPYVGGGARGLAPTDTVPSIQINTRST